MPEFAEHIKQAKRNLLFLEHVNQSKNQFLDWQVTICYYVAVHLINAHLSLHNMQYRKHIDVKHALNPKNTEAIKSRSAFEQNEYLAYMKLQSLSRRSRYLVNEKDDNLGSTQAFITYDIHLARALRHLDTLIKYFKATYQISIDPVNVTCSEIRKSELSFCK